MTAPLEVVVPSGESSSGIQLWACTPDTQFYYTMTGSQGVEPKDVDAPDESTWMYMSLDDVTYGAAGAGLTNLGTVGPGPAVYKTFYVKFTVPAGQDAQIKTDLRLRRTYTKHAVAS